MSSDITMEGIIDFELPKFRQNRDQIAWGDPTFKIGKKEVPLKFRETVWNLGPGEENRFLLHFHASQIDKISYAAAYDAAGLMADDINMDLLMKITGIAEFPVLLDCEDLGERGLLPPQIINHYGSFEIKALSLSDGETVFTASKPLLKNYTETVKMEAAMIRQLVNMLYE